MSSTNKEILIESISSRFLLGRRRFVSISSETFEATDLHTRRSVMLIKARGEFLRGSRRALDFLECMPKLEQCEVRIPEVYTFGITQSGECFISCESVFGSPLNTLRLSDDDIYSVAKNVCEIISKFNKIGVTFGSLTLDSFTWNGSEVVFVGLIPMLGEVKRSMNAADEQVYSRFIAPELKDQTPKASSDIFSIGLILLEIAAKKRVEIPRNAEGLSRFLNKELRNNTKRAVASLEWITDAVENSLVWDLTCRASSVEGVLSLIKKPKRERGVLFSLIWNGLNYQVEELGLADYLIKAFIIGGIITAGFYAFSRDREQSGNDIASVDLVAGVKGLGVGGTIFRRGTDDGVSGLPGYVTGGEERSLFSVGTDDDILENHLKGKKNSMQNQSQESVSNGQAASAASQAAGKSIKNIPLKSESSAIRPVAHEMFVFSNRLLTERCVKVKSTLLPMQKMGGRGLMCGEPIDRKFQICLESLVYKMVSQGQEK